MPEHDITSPLINIFTREHGASVEHTGGISEELKAAALGNKPPVSWDPDPERAERIASASIADAVKSGTYDEVAQEILDSITQG